jgi:hypothetical protein
MLRDWSDRVPEPSPSSRYVRGGCAALFVLAVAIMVYSAIAPALR